jgi:hypothetical protein
MKELNDVGGVLPKGSDITLKNAKQPLLGFLAKVATDQTRERLLGKLTKIDEHGNQIFDIDNPKIEKPTAEARALIERGFTTIYPNTLDGVLKYDPQYFRIKDIAAKAHSGTGSLGLPRMLILIEGPTNATDDDRILDTKTQTVPCGVLFQYWDRRQEYEELFGDNHANAFCKSVRAMTGHKWRFLGWLRTLNGATFSVNEVSPYKAAFDITTLSKDGDYTSMSEQWGYILANAHVHADTSGSRVSDHIEKAITERVKSIKDGDQVFVDWIFAATSKFANQVHKDTVKLTEAIKERKYKCPPPVQLAKYWQDDIFE